MSASIARVARRKRIVRKGRRVAAATLALAAASLAASSLTLERPASGLVEVRRFPVMPAPALVRASSLDGAEYLALLANSPGAAKAAGARLKDFDFITSVATSTTTLAIPAAAKTGDLCVCFNGATQNSTVPTLVVPTDFDVLADHSRSDANLRVRGVIFAKILEADEPGQDRTLMSGGNTNMGIFAIFRPNARIESFTANGVQGQGTGGSPSQQTINVLASPSFPAISLAHWNATSQVSNRVSTNLTSIAGDHGRHWGGYRIDASADVAANGVVNMNDSGSQTMQSLYLTFT